MSTSGKPSTPTPTPLSETSQTDSIAVTTITSEHDTEIDVTSQESMLETTTDNVIEETSLDSFMYSTIKTINEISTSEAIDFSTYEVSTNGEIDGEIDGDTGFTTDGTFQQSTQDVADLTTVQHSTEEEVYFTTDVPVNLPWSRSHYIPVNLPWSRSHYIPVNLPWSRSHYIPVNLPWSRSLLPAIPWRLTHAVLLIFALGIRRSCHSHSCFLNSRQGLGPGT